MKLEFFWQVFERFTLNLIHSRLMKIRPVGAELFHMDRQMNSQADMMNLIIHFCNFANAPKHYIFKLILNFSINDSLEIWSRFKKFKITFVWKHEYSVIINGCPKARTRAFFSVTVEDTLQQVLMWDFFMTLMEKCWSGPADAFIFTSTIFPNPSPKILIGWKRSIETFSWPVLPLVSVCHIFISTDRPISAIIL